MAAVKQKNPRTPGPFQLWVGTDAPMLETNFRIDGAISSLVLCLEAPALKNSSARYIRRCSAERIDQVARRLEPRTENDTHSWRGDPTGFPNVSRMKGFQRTRHAGNIAVFSLLKHKGEVATRTSFFRWSTEYSAQRSVRMFISVACPHRSVYLF